MSVRSRNGFEMSDFSVDIYEREDSLRVRVDCFAVNDVQAPFNVYKTEFIAKTSIIDEITLYYILSKIITKLVNDIVDADIQIPEPCECQSREWFDKHPYDRQEYWRAKNGRIYPKDHTVQCPNNPAN